MGVRARRLSGGCLCGAVEYAVTDTFEYALNCHCSQCRRSTGSAFKPLAGIALSDLEVVQGNEAIMIYGQEDKAHDVHCGTCGSLLFSIVREGCYAHVLMGTLFDEPSVRPSMHIFVGSKAAWFDITDDLPQHETLPIR